MPMAQLHQDRTITMLGEQQLLQRLYHFCAEGVVGDDGAVLMPQTGHALVVTTDMLVEGVHFSDRTTSASDVGWRSAAANLSDLAAMGATPLGITLSLGLPASLAVEWLDQLYIGMAQCLQTYGTAIIGGDLSRSPVVTVSITAVGEVLPHQQILRSVARPGDAIVATGSHGAARAGLELLTHPEWGQALSPADRVSLTQAHQRPCPRLDVLPVLRQLTPPSRIAGMDSSDGLADAILQICQASGVGATLEQAGIPIPPVLENSDILDSQEALQWALYGGEDFELVLCLPPPAAQELVTKLGSAAKVVGHIVPGNKVKILGRNGVEQPLELKQGFQHFG
jgi:thiamine-monophosphate kinase